MTNRRELLAHAAMGLTLTNGIARAASAADAGAEPSAALLSRARSLLAKGPLIDTHNDLPSMFLEQGAGDLSKYDLNVRQPKLCADIPALREGRVGAQYWSIFVEAETMKNHVSLHESMREFDVTLRMIEGVLKYELTRQDGSGFLEVGYLLPKK